MNTSLRGPFCCIDVRIKVVSQYFHISSSMINETKHLWGERVLLYIFS